MNREDLLKKIREENEYDSPYEYEVSSSSWRIGAVVALVVSMVIFYLERIVWGKYNVGLFMSVMTIMAVKETVSAVKIKTASSIVYAVVSVVLFIVTLIIYIIAFVIGWL